MEDIWQIAYMILYSIVCEDNGGKDGGKESRLDVAVSLGGDGLCWGALEGR